MWQLQPCELAMMNLQHQMSSQMAVLLDCTSRKLPKLLVLNWVDTASFSSSSCSVPFELRSIGSAPFWRHIGVVL